MASNDEKPARSLSQALREAAVVEASRAPTVAHHTMATQTTAEPMRDLINETLTEIKRDLDADERCYDSVTHCMTVISQIVKERVRTMVPKHPPPQAAASSRGHPAATTGRGPAAAVDNRH